MTMIGIKYRVKIIWFVISIASYCSQAFSANHIDIHDELKQQDEHYMNIAFEHARRTPGRHFAALIIDNKSLEILAEGIDNVSINPTFHGEMVAIANCAKKHPNVNWKNVTLYTTAEPCSMCQSAVVWAEIPRVVYGTSSDYLNSHGWKRINIRAIEINKKAPYYVGTLQGGVLENKTNTLFNGSIK